LAYFAAAAAFGLVRLWRWTAARLNQSSASFQHMPAAGAPTMAAVALFRNSRTALRPLLVLFLVIWTVGWAVGSYVTAGRGPGGARYDPTPISAHDKLLPRFIAQIPADAAVTATAAVHPHLSNRRFVYQFPTGVQPPGNADWALLDVTTATDMAPGDVRSTVEQMLAGEWGVVDGADGFLLLHKGPGEKQIPPAFYDFARTTHSDKGNAATGQAPLTLVAATADDWPRWRATELSTLWQVGDSFDADTMKPMLEIRTPGGDTLYDLAQTLPPALVWYPPQSWQAGDQVRVTTSPLYLPRDFGVVVERTPGLAVLPAGVGNDQTQLVAAFERREGDQLAALATTPVSTTQTLDAWLQGASASPSTPITARFMLQAGKELTLTATLASHQLWPRATVDARLAWQGLATNTWPSGLSAFVHLRQAGTNADQEDGLPRYFVLDPQPSAGRWVDWRQMTAPRTPTTTLNGDWQVVVGLYDPATGKRMPVIDGAGNPGGDEVVVGTLTWRDAPVPDQACALIPAACAAQVEEYK
jgi:hypothetical protein